LRSSFSVVPSKTSGLTFVEPWVGRSPSPWLRCFSRTFQDLLRSSSAIEHHLALSTQRREKRHSISQSSAALCDQRPGPVISAYLEERCEKSDSRKCPTLLSYPGQSPTLSHFQFIITSVVERKWFHRSVRISFALFRWPSMPEA
jgi:hypothetical protein